MWVKEPGEGKARGGGPLVDIISGLRPTTRCLRRYVGTRAGPAERGEESGEGQVPKKPSGTLLLWIPEDGAALAHAAIIREGGRTKQD